jgi:phage shock protein A
MSVKITSQISSPEDEWNELQIQIMEWEQKQGARDRFTEHYSFTTPKEMWFTLKSFAADCWKYERDNRELCRENDRLKGALKGHRAAIDRLEQEVEKLKAELKGTTSEWAALSNA